jgi:hypothetical protein
MRLVLFSEEEASGSHGSRLSSPVSTSFVDEFMPSRLP